MSSVSVVAQSGTLESNDIMIVVSPGDSGIVIDLQSMVKKQYGEAICRTIKLAVEEQGLTDIYVKAIDKGALDCTVHARILTALSRAGIVLKEGTV